MTVHAISGTGRTAGILSLKLGYFGKVEIAHFHGRRYHVKSFLTAGPHRTVGGQLRQPKRQARSGAERHRQNADQKVEEESAQHEWQPF